MEAKGRGTQSTFLLVSSPTTATTAAAAVHADRQTVFLLNIDILCVCSLLIRRHRSQSLSWNECGLGKAQCTLQNPRTYSASWLAISLLHQRAHSMRQSGGRRPWSSLQHHHHRWLIHGRERINKCDVKGCSIKQCVVICHKICTVVHKEWETIKTMVLFFKRSRDSWDTAIEQPDGWCVLGGKNYSRPQSLSQKQNI